MVTETWRPVPGYENRYEVSDLGRVRSLDHVVTNKRGYPRPVRGQILKPKPTTRGYLCVTIAGKSPTVHSLVLLAFIGVRPAGLISRHLNDVQTDNRLVNLSYGTISENGHDAVRNGRHPGSLKTHCPHGHEYSGYNLIIRAGGRRGCRECQRAKDRRRWQRKKTSARQSQLSPA